MAKEKWIGTSLYAVITAMFLTIPLSAGCSSKVSISQPTEAKKKPPELNIAAAISLKDTLKELAAGFEKKENVKIVFNFASSGDLMTQIEQGAPADIFISAGKNQMDSLEQEGIIDKNSRFNLISNDLVVIVPKTSRLSIPKIEDLASASGVEKIAIGEPGVVPAGRYTKESLETADIWATVQDKLVMTKDVRQALNYVETGNIDAGFVYKSDAASTTGVKIALVVPDSYHKLIVYPAAIVNVSHQKRLAAKFEDYLKSDMALDKFEASGFKPVVKKTE